LAAEASGAARQGLRHSRRWIRHQRPQGQVLLLWELLDEGRSFRLRLDGQSQCQVRPDRQGPAASNRGVRGLPCIV